MECRMQNVYGLTNMLKMNMVCGKLLIRIVWEKMTQIPMNRRMIQSVVNLQPSKSPNMIGNDMKWR